MSCLLRPTFIAVRESGSKRSCRCGCNSDTDPRFERDFDFDRGFHRPFERDFDRRFERDFDCDRRDMRGRRFDY